MTRGIRITTAFLVLLLGAATAAVAQTTGTVRGTVRAASTAHPLEGAQVLVVGTGRGSLTNREGHFLIVGVPAGSHQVRVQLLGYGAVDLPVTVAAGQAVEVTAQLETEAVALEGIVVTGQPSATRRREIGASVAVIDAEATTERAPVSTVSQLLQGREAGVTGFGASGTVGTTGTLVLRGMTSMSQSNSPVVYVDGVRVDASEKPNFFFNLGGQSTSRLNDLNPADIERVEIVKGAAASALYGTEASNGVIQIFTKRGRPGESTLNASVKVGASRIPDVLPLTHPDPQYASPNEILETGRYQEYSVSARGGTDRARHYVSAGYTSDDGSFPSNRFERANGMLHLGFAPLESVTADVTSGLTWSKARLPFNDSHSFGVLINLLNDNPLAPRWPGGGVWAAVPYTLDIENTDETYRFTQGLTLRQQLGSAFEHRAVFGLDLVMGEGTTRWPYAPNILVPTGARWVAERDNRSFNFDYSASLSTRLSDDLSSTLSAGVQAYSAKDHRIFSTSDAFALPDLWLMGDAANTDVTEEQVEYTTGGVYVQEQVGISERFFVSAGLRVDGSSAFGEDFGLQAYPKVSASYVVSDEAWFGIPAVSTLRLRGGYGMAGTQPEVFAAQRTYTTFSGPDAKTAIHMGSIGNPDLAPEVSHEWEGGFDAGLLDERVSLSVTGYHQTTRDALLNRPVAPSMGFTANQLVNVGEIRNVGVETSLRAVLAETGRLRWDVDFGYAYNRNEVVDMGGVAPFTIDRFGSRVVEGYPLGGKWQLVSTGTAANGMPIRSDSAVYTGSGIPPHTGSFGSSLSYGGWELFGNAQWAAGQVVTNNTLAYQVLMRTGEEYFQTLIDNGGNAQSPAVQALVARAGLLGEYTEDADWLKVREVGVRYSLPASWARRLGGSRASLGVSGRNLLTLSPYSGADPEVSATVVPLTTGYELAGTRQYSTFSVGNDFFTVPQARQLVMSFDVQF